MEKFVKGGKEYHYYFVTYADDSTKVVYTPNKPEIGRIWNPLTGEYEGPEIKDVNVVSEKDLMLVYPRKVITLPQFFNMQKQNKFNEDIDATSLKYRNGQDVLDEHSRLIGKNGRYEVWEPNAPYEKKLPDSDLTITINDRDGEYEIFVIDKQEKKTYWLYADVEDSPLKDIRNWLKTHIN